MTQLAGRHTSLVTVHHLTVQNRPGALHDPDGQALHRLGLTARYLVRPDGHIGYRAGGTDVTGLARYLSHRHRLAIILQDLVQRAATLDR